MIWGIRGGQVSSKQVMVGANRYVVVPVQTRPVEVPVRAWNDLAQLNDYLIDHLRYDHEKARAMDHPGYSGRHQSPEETLRTGRGVCQDYAALFEVLAAQKGYTVRSVRSTQLDHAWNEVLLAGRWWLIDVTWNDAEIFADGTSLPSQLRADPDHRRRHFLTTVEREEELKRAGLLKSTHRARDVEPVDYARTREAYAIVDALDPMVRQYNAVVEQQREANRRTNEAIERLNALVDRHNGQTTAAAQERFKAPLAAARDEVARLRAEREALDPRAQRLSAQIDDQYTRFRALAAAHPLAVTYTLG